MQALNKVGKPLLFLATILLAMVVSDFSNLYYQLAFLLILLCILARYYVYLDSLKEVVIENFSTIKTKKKNDFDELVCDLNSKFDLNGDIFLKNIQRNLNLYSNYQQMSLIFAILGDEKSKEIFKFLKDDDKQILKENILNSHTISKNAAYEVLYIFLNDYIENDDILLNTLAFRENLIDVAYEISKSECKIKFEKEFEISELFDILKNENLQIVSLVLLNLTYALSKEILDRFDENSRANIIHNMSHMREFSQDVIKILADSLNKKLANSSKIDKKYLRKNG